MLIYKYYTIIVDPPNTAALGTGEKTAVLENGGKGCHIYNREKKRSIQDLKISGGIGRGRLYWDCIVYMIVVKGVKLAIAGEIRDVLGLPIMSLRMTEAARYAALFSILEKKLKQRICMLADVS